MLHVATLGMTNRIRERICAPASSDHEDFVSTAKMMPRLSSLHGALQEGLSFASHVN
ncbi:hypothetical protein X734_23610 [Mesorhizobium sp. L2C084A000]|nr:hypothetical protein X734_23610 [Mesorhizobium sp. L2C084A000]